MNTIPVGKLIAAIVFVFACSGCEDTKEALSPDVAAAPVSTQAQPHRCRATQSQSTQKGCRRGVELAGS
jgi:hypothetical protein